MKSRGYLLAFALVALPVAATAQISNPGFEDPINFHFWSTFGDNQIEGSSLGSGPIEGSNQALLATATDGTVNSNVVPGTGDTEAQVEAGLGLSANSLKNFSGSNIVLASGISPRISLQAGQHVTFSLGFSHQPNLQRRNQRLDCSERKLERFLFCLPQRFGRSTVIETSGHVLRIREQPEPSRWLRNRIHVNAPDQRSVHLGNRVPNVHNHRCDNGNVHAWPRRRPRGTCRRT